MCGLSDCAYDSGLTLPGTHPRFQSQSEGTVFLDSKCPVHQKNCSSFSEKKTADYGHSDIPDPAATFFQAVSTCPSPSGVDMGVLSGLSDDMMKAP